MSDNLSAYKWLSVITEQMDGDPFLPVGKIAKEHHAMIDPMTELELDYGPDIRNKILAVDPNAIKHDEES